MNAPDLTYRQSCGMFTAFFAETEAGRGAWSLIAAQSDGTGKVLNGHVAGALRQLRAAGYVVAKASRRASDALSDDELAAALE